MAELQQTQVLPAPFIQAAAQTYLDDLTSAVGDYSTANLAQTMGPQFVAGLDPLQQQAASLTQQGVDLFDHFYNLHKHLQVHKLTSFYVSLSKRCYINYIRRF